MPHYSFHFHGKQSVANFFDESFSNDQEATSYAQAMSAKFRADIPNMCEGKYVRDHIAALEEKLRQLNDTREA